MRSDCTMTLTPQREPEERIPQTEAPVGATGAGADNETLVPREALQPLMARADGPAIRRLCGHLLALVGGGVLVWAGSGSWLLWPAMFLMGVVWVHLFALQHECAHGTAFRTHRANAIVASICGALIMVPEQHFKYEHTDHHTNTNLLGRDPQLIPMPATYREYLWYLTGLPYWWSNGLGLLRRAAGRLTQEEIGFVRASARNKVVAESRALVAVYACAAAAIAAGWQPLLTYWVIPLLLGQPVMRFIRMTEHVGCAHAGDPTRNTRSTRVAWPWQFLAWNMNFHGEHHLAPRVPFHALPSLSRLVAGRIPLRDGYWGAHREILARLRQERGHVG
jgi:fatty acid desaturase